MDFLSFILEISLLLAAIVAYYLKTFRPNISKSNKTRAPEPPGAWPLIGHLHLLGGQSPVARTLGAMVDKHGPIFSLRLGSHQGLVVSNFKAIKDCFTTNDKNFATRPAMAVGKYIGYNYAVFALAPYGPYWREVRKMATLELLTAHRLHKLRHVRATEADYFIKDLYSKSIQHPDKALDLGALFEHYTFNVIIRMLAGQRCSLAGNGDQDKKARKFKEDVKKALYLGGVFVLSDAIPWLEWLDIGGYVKAMKETSKEMDKVLGDWVDDRIRTRKESESKENETDFMDVMLSVMPENETVSGYERETVIKATLLILIMTGSESTGETLIWALSLLLNHPHVLKKAQNELETKIGSHKWVEESDINSLDYLQAIVKETLRLYPPGPLSGPREAIQDCYIGGYYVPQGTRLIVNLWKLHRDPDVWSDPDEFRPERFVNGENNHTNFRGQCFEYIPFSSGRRMCPGMTFGLQVVQLALARLLQGFNLSTPMGEPVDMGEGLGIALPKLKPLEAVLTPRLPRELYENL